MFTKIIEGWGGAIDTGLKHVTGVYLTLLDADDYYLPESVVKRAYFLNNNNCRKNQKLIVEQKIEMWSRASIVLTDRLHGMIFSAITGTPCVAFSNYNHKIKESYEWIKYLPYIKYAENITQAREYIEELVNMKESNYDITPLLPYFDKISEILRECS